MRIFLTGMAGFIGFHLALALAKRGEEIIGFDNINDYYDVNLKYARLSEAGFDAQIIKDSKFSSKDSVEFFTSNKYSNLKFIKADLKDFGLLDKIFKENKIDVVVNLAAQAGVRYSLINPHAYISSNIDGFLNILECCKNAKVSNLVYASSSSVYGLNESMPFSPHDSTEHPISLYAATKKSNEMMAHAYSHLFGIPTTGLRFFTVYGEWGRPDMALFLFVKAALENEEIEVFNNGDMMRDFTYISDIVTGIISCIDNPAKPNKDWDAMHPDPSSSSAAYRIYNIGNSSPVKLLDYIKAIEKATGKEIKKKFMPMQSGDVPATYADTIDLARDFEYQPSTPIQTGVNNFVKWYREFYKV